MDRKREIKKMKEKHLFSNKDIWKLLLPIMVEQLLASLMGMVDTIMVSNVGSAAISAVSLVDSINILVIQLFSALAAGGAILCSQYMGGKNVRQAENAANQVLLTVTALSTAMTVICLLFRRPLLALIWGVGIGVAGAAISTLVSRIFCAVVVMIWLHRPCYALRVYNYRAIRPEWKYIRRILAVGVPSGIENAMFQFGKLAIQSTVSTLGTVAIAAQAMTNIMENLNGIAAIGVGIGLMTVVGQSIGAGRNDEAVYYIKKFTGIGEIVIIISCAAVFAAGRMITVLGGMEPESAEMCLYMLTAITIVKPIVWTLAFIPAYGMRAAGDVKFSMIVSCISMWMLRVVLCVYLCRVQGFGPIAVWIGMFTDWTARGIAFLWRFHSRKWLLHKVTA